MNLHSIEMFFTIYLILWVWRFLIFFSDVNNHSTHGFLNNVLLSSSKLKSVERFSITFLLAYIQYTIIRTYEFHTTQYLVKRQHIHISTFWTERERTTEWLHTTLFTKIVNREKFKETDYQFKVINISCWYVSSRLLCKLPSQ